jgi:uncharacterized membrane protein
MIYIRNNCLVWWGYEFINPLEHVVIGISAEGVYAYNYHMHLWVYQTHNLTTNKTVIPYIYIPPYLHNIR